MVAIYQYTTSSVVASKVASLEHELHMCKHPLVPCWKGETQIQTSGMISQTLRHATQEGAPDAQRCLLHQLQLNNASLKADREENTHLVAEDVAGGVHRLRFCKPSQLGREVRDGGANGGRLTQLIESLPELCCTRHGCT